MRGKPEDQCERERGMTGDRLVLVAHGNERKRQMGRKECHLVVEVGHGLLSPTWQTSCQVSAALNVVHLVVPIVELGIRVTPPLGWTIITTRRTTAVSSCSSFAKNWR